MGIQPMSGAEDNAKARPLLTFALFAYNQEKYVQEAVAGAFAQTYEPLEIILSDDCSTDKTFELMQRMAEEYRGPHRVVVRRSAANKGTLNHVLSVARQASGVLLVIAAGDDVSHPQRCSCIVESWASSDARAFYSRFDKIDENGGLIARNLSAPGNQEVMEWFPEGVRQPFVHGATSAIELDILRSLSDSSAPIFFEDAILYFVLTTLGMKIVCIEESLIRYREHPEAAANAPAGKDTYLGITLFEEKISRAANNYIALCDYCCSYLARLGVHDAELHRRISQTRSFSRKRASWMRKNLMGRLIDLRRSTTWREFRFLAPRFFGLTFFAFSKAAIRCAKGRRR